MTRLTPRATRTSRASRWTLAATAASAVVLLPGLTQLPALAEDDPSPARLTGEALDDVRTIGDAVHGLDDVDVREAIEPLTGQVRAVSSLGAMDSVRWNDFGTPASLLPADGSLGAVSGSPADGARAWLRGHAAAFGLSSEQVGALELVQAQEMPDSDARAVLFRQRYGDLTAAGGGLVTVGVSDGQVRYVSSSLIRDPQAPPEAELSALDGWLAAAKDVGRAVTGGDVGDIRTSESQGWTRLQVPGLTQEQMVRLRGLGMPDGSTRPVWEANVIDTARGAALAHTVLVDAVSGEVLVRRNQVDNSQNAENFSGSFTAADCGPQHSFELTDDKTRTISLTAISSPADDVTVNLYGPDGQKLAGYDLATSPETGTYSPGGQLPQGTYSAEVCPFDDASVVTGQYTLTVVTSDQAAPSGGGLPEANPRWRYFLANPRLDSPTQTPQNSVVGCWLYARGCDDPPGVLRNVQAFAPWDATTNGVPTFTTIGNNANTHEAWASPLTPGGTAQAPISPERSYTEEFTDAWNNEQCNPAELRPGGNDINVSVGNLFVAHNRMHDYSYYLGFTEKNYNMQQDNAGRYGVPGDPEIGNAQAGALSGGQPSFLGRDNANQISLQDGVPGITNQYLFQPIAGSFYAPCTDGGLDMGIVGHEYTHAISNRMVAGPDEGLTSEQGGAMGESWSDLVAAEYHVSHGYSNGGNVWAVGVYATGNEQVAIRDYAINRNPLNYSDYGFDSTGAEVHADGEIWNGTQYTVRQALVKKWNSRYPASNRHLQRRCAQGTPRKSPLPARVCPGNRRWVQLMFDSFLLQQGATSMLDARDAMIAADRMRFDGANRSVLWSAFARRGMGQKASTPTADSEDVKPGFSSPAGPNGTVTFRAPKGGRIFVGDYEARVTPVADTLKKTKLGRTVRFTPGTYRMLYTSPRRAAKRFTIRVTPGRTSVRVTAPKNLAAVKSGAKVIGASADSRNPDFLLDGTEATNWGGVNADGTTNVDEQSPFVAVDLAGAKARRISRVNVSAMLRPAPASATDLPLLADAEDDPDSGSRFTALRKFALERCVRSCGSESARWKRFFTSAGDAFPGKQPRPVAPNLIMRSFRVPKVKASAVRLVALENQCTGYAGYAGEQDADPLNNTDCKTASDRGTIVHAAELQVW